jgi:hypothetical protein
MHTLFCRISSNKTNGNRKFNKFKRKMEELEHLTEIISYSSFFQTKDYTTTACSETQN